MKSPRYPALCRTAPGMSLYAVLFCLLAALTLPVRAATTPVGQTVSFPSGQETVHGVLYKPAGSGPFPAIILIHEWWGLNEWVKQQAADFAQHGYVALAVDLYRGQVAPYSDMEMAHELMRALPQDRGMDYLTSADAYLKTRKDVKANHMGAVGWCMGGNYAMQFAIAEPSLRAVAINYGAPETNVAQLKKIHAQILGNFGGLDRGITSADIHSFAQQMQALGHLVDVKIYPDAGHAFENSDNKSAYKPQDAADAHQRMMAFFAKNLKG